MALSKVLGNAIQIFRSELRFIIIKYPSIKMTKEYTVPNAIDEFPIDHNFTINIT